MNALTSWVESKQLVDNNCLKRQEPLLEHNNMAQQQA
jgi:hypothetical protein